MPRSGRRWHNAAMYFFTPDLHARESTVLVTIRRDMERLAGVR